MHSIQETNSFTATASTVFNQEYEEEALVAQNNAQDFSISVWNLEEAHPSKQ